VCSSDLIESIRITVPGLDSDEGHGPPKVSSIMSQIKSKPQDDGGGPAKYEKPTGTPVWEQKTTVSGEAQSTKLKQMLAGLKSNKDI